MTAGRSSRSIHRSTARVSPQLSSGVCSPATSARANASSRSTVSPALRQAVGPTSAAGFGPRQGAAECANERRLVWKRAARQAREGDDEIGQLIAFRCAAEDVQVNADLHLL